VLIINIINVGKLFFPLVHELIMCKCWVD